MSRGKQIHPPVVLINFKIKKMNIKELAINKILANIDKEENELRDLVTWSGFGWFDMDNFEEIKKSQISASQKRIEVWKYILNATKKFDEKVD